MNGIKAAGIVALTGMAIFAGASGASAQVKVGTLACSGAGGPGYIVGSQKTFACRFSPTGRGAERYTATVTRIGLDVGVTGPTSLIWDVFAPSTSLKRGVLAGQYAGASADAAITVGGGASVLVGGSNNTVSLQPVSVQSQQGVNVAVGVSSLVLSAR